VSSLRDVLGMSGSQNEIEQGNPCTPLAAKWELSYSGDRFVIPRDCMTNPLTKILGM